MTDRPLDLSQARVALIVNGKAGRQDADAQVAMIREKLAPLVGELALRPVRFGSRIGAAARDAAQAGFDIVAALGGDGTQSAVAHALAGSTAAMAVLPGGTFNYFARELGVETMETALDALAGGVVMRRDLGTVNGRVFINNASFGLYPRILQQREDIYRRWGRSRIAAYGSVLVALRDLRRPMVLTLMADGAPRTFRTPLAFAARSAYQIEHLGLDGAEAVRAGHIALYIARGNTRWALALAALRLAFGATVQGEDFDLVIADALQIETGKRRRLVALDGEKEAMTAPFKLEVMPGALRVLVPAPQGAAPA